MPVGPANSSADENEWHGESGVGEKPFAGFQPEEALPRIACASGQSKSGEGRGQPHLSIAWLAERQSEAKGWQGRARDGEPR